ncbi:MAG: 16S rRNA (cytosine(1402)-N(4))-methyltransferase RsmH [Dehalococcoidales bacterium]|nr:16S rRNA (cytosine(1402)-N(4))-methyltransferase RsmH [Dehalococcoidales bacterium]
MLSVAHKPVLLKEVVTALAVQPGGRYIDCTLGGGGHARAILDHSSPGGQLLGIDADPEAIRTATLNLSRFAYSALLVNANFANLDDICRRYNFYPVHGILMDLGLSSLQLANDPRGFSFQHEADLDMRFNPEQKITASDIVNTYSESDLANIIRSYGEEDNSYRIARRIVQARPIYTTLRLASVVEEAVGGRKGRIHPATRTFQALRIAVNEELEHLEEALRKTTELLGIGGRLVVISYHSLEDRIVKHFMQRESRDCLCPPRMPVCRCGHKATMRLINKKVITPSEQEIEQNPRSRSARMRVAERIDSDSKPYGYRKNSRPGFGQRGFSLN